MARTTEVGGRTLVHSAAAGTESHGQYMSEAKVKEPSAFVKSHEGAKVQERVHKELMNSRMQRWCFHHNIGVRGLGTYVGRGDVQADAAAHGESALSGMDFVTISIPLNQFGYLTFQEPTFAPMLTSARPGKVGELPQPELHHLEGSDIAFATNFSQRAKKIDTL